MDTFCVLPWYSKEISSIVTPCCLMRPGYDLEQVKKDLLSGVQSQSCNRCWEIEAGGKQSRRQQENIFFDYKLDRDLSNIQQDCKQGLATTMLYQITTSNLCNQACVTCGSRASSKWADVERKMGLFPIKVLFNDIEQHNIDYKTAQRIELMGGEPLFDPKTIDVFKKLLEHNNTDCTISLVTNGSIKLTPALKEMFSNFSNLNICVSIDGTGSVFEYMRWPTKWNTLKKNLEQYRTVIKHLSISYTISSVNALYYDQTVAWFKSNQLPYNHNIVYTPSWLSLSSAPVELKKHLIAQNNFVSTLSQINGKEFALDQYRNKLQKQDSAKKIQLEYYLPELASIIFDNQ
jgi:hypothetical protein